jgi:hypothetical protein
LATQTNEVLPNGGGTAGDPFGFLLIFTDFYGFLRIFTDFYGFLRIFTDFYGFLRIFTDFYGFLRILRIFTYFYVFLRILAHASKTYDPNRYIRCTTVSEANAKKDLNEPWVYQVSKYHQGCLLVRHVNNGKYTKWPHNISNGRTK